MCDEAFDLLGISGTTDAVAPLLVINGGVGVVGPGWRANATIGRALRLIWANVGGAKPGIIIGENEEESPWEPLHVEHGFSPGDSTVAVLAGEPPQATSAPRSRRAQDILATVARSMEVIGHLKATGLGDTLVIVSPEHARTIAGDGWSKADIRRFLWERLQTPAPKFRAPENLKVLVAGGTAGRFTAVVASWPFANAPSSLVIKKIRFAS